MTDGVSKPFFSKRMVLSLIGLAISTAMLATGKLDGTTWVFALATILAGHHAADIVKAWKGN